MREYGKVYTKFWTGRARELSEDGRLLFLYLLTSPHSTGIGCYRLPMAYIAEDLGWGVRHPGDTVYGRVSDTVKELVAQGVIDHDEQRGWVRLVNWFEHNPIENPSVAKSFIPFIEAVPKESPLRQKLIESLLPLAHRFPDGYIHRARHGEAHPVAVVSDTESSSSSRESKNKNTAAAVDKSVVTRTNGHDQGQKEINLQNFDAAAACAFAVDRRMLTAADEAVMISWHRLGYDIEKDVLPVLIAKRNACMKKNKAMPANPLSYWADAVKEAAEARKSNELR